MKSQNLFSEPSKTEFRGKRNVRNKDRHHEIEEPYIDGNVKKYQRHDLDFEADVDDLIDLDPSFNWGKIR